MAKSSKIREWDMLACFDRFIADSRTGRRLQPNGKMVSAGTISNYENARKLVFLFSEHKGFPLRLRSVRYLDKREWQRERNYWKKFYKQFTNYLYQERNLFDNYVCSVIKNVRLFLRYCNRGLSMDVGDFYREFYARKEEVPIVVLQPEELNFLIYDRDFENTLPRRLREAKDFFVFGCTVALRFSDLVRLKPTHLRTVNEDWYIVVRTQKTGTDLVVKLPNYAIQILKKYNPRRGYLLPRFNRVNCGEYLKKLAERAGFTHKVDKFRERRGRRVPLAREINGRKTEYRFCDVISTHTMRRTAITTMLCLGMPENLVRKISGHSAGSREFYRYVAYSQRYQDEQAMLVFDRLKERRLMGDAASG